MRILKQARHQSIEVLWCPRGIALQCRGATVPERRRTAFADILRTEPDPLLDNLEDKLQPVSPAKNADQQAQTLRSASKKNKAISPDYTKLTAYIPRSLASAVKMCMALDQTSDQSEYVEAAISEWIRSKGRNTLLDQCGYHKKDL
jgi:hypothetical protein